mgnify:CR=1 FL=1
MSLVYILVVALGIGLLIFIHELGHFVFAKLSNVKVEKFSLGFGPELFGFTRGETRYSLRIVPLGGYVKMLGEDPGERSGVDLNAVGAAVAPAPTIDPRSFAAQPFYKKAAIIVAGSVFNILLALVFFVAVFQIGISFPAAHIGSVDYGSPAYYAGIRPGDYVTAINRRTDVDFEDLFIKTVLADPSRPLDLTLRRGSEVIPIVVRPEFSRTTGASYIGVGQTPSLKIQALAALPTVEDPSAGGAGESSAAQAAGVKPGSTIVSVNGDPVTDWWDFQRSVLANGLTPFSLTVSLDGSEKTLTITPERNPEPLLGILADSNTTITEVASPSIAADMGLKAGDIIVSVGSAECSNPFVLANAITAQMPDPPPLVVTRDGARVELPWKKLPQSGLDFIADITTEILARAAAVEPAGPAELLGIMPGDDILAVDSQPVVAFRDIPQLLRKAEGPTIAVQWRHNGEILEGSFAPVFLGIIPGNETVSRQLGLARSCTMGMRKAYDAAAQIYILLKKAVSGQASIGKKLSGPVGVAYISYKYAQQGVTRFMFLLAIIGINLGVVNLLPIPILDGGLLAIFVVEKVKGSPLSQNATALLQYAGLAVIILLFVFVTWQDIMRFFG